MFCKNEGSLLEAGQPGCDGTLLGNGFFVRDDAECVWKRVPGGSNGGKA